MTNEQQKKLTVLRSKNSQQMEKLRNSLRETRRALFEATQNATPNKAKITALSKTMAEKLAAMALFRSQCRKEVKAILTPEQQTKLEQYRQSKPTVQ